MQGSKCVGVKLLHLTLDLSDDLGITRESYQLLHMLIRNVEFHDTVLNIGQVIIRCSGNHDITYFVII